MSLKRPEIHCAILDRSKVSHKRIEQPVMGWRQLAWQKPAWSNFSFFFLCFTRARYHRVRRPRWNSWWRVGEQWKVRSSLARAISLMWNQTDWWTNIPLCSTAIYAGGMCTQKGHPNFECLATSDDTVNGGCMRAALSHYKESGIFHIIYR